MRSLFLDALFAKRLKRSRIRYHHIHPCLCYRGEETPSFSYIGLDYAEPFFVKSTGEEERKVWICLFTCCSTRAVTSRLYPV